MKGWENQINLIHGDCLEEMRLIHDQSIDLVLTDMPYGMTFNRWDTVIDLDKMWVQVKRIIKDRTAVCFFAKDPFGARLIMSNPKMFKYNWIWIKDSANGFLHAKRYPMGIHEKISVFCKKPHIYNPVMREGKPYVRNTKGKVSKNYDLKRNPNYVTINKGERYPLTMIKFKRDKNKLHPTQKPVALLEYLIKTYTNEGDTVLDFTMGSGSTGVAAKNLNRKFIGIEKDEKYFEVARERLSESRTSI